MLERREKEKFDFLFIIPIKEEFNYFQEIISIKETKQYNSDYFYILDIPNSEYTGVAAIDINPGIGRSIQVVNRALFHFDVKMIVLIGLAGGVDNSLKLGDLIIADVIFEYEANSKAVNNERTEELYQIIPSPNYWRINFSLERYLHHFQFIEPNLFKEFQSEANVFFNKLDLDNSLKEMVNDTPVYKIGRIASGNIVATSKAFIDELKKRDRKILAIEMEAAGVLRAASEINGPIPTLIIRGISDLADERKKDFDNIKEGVFRKLAIRNAIHLFLTLIHANSFEDVFKKYFYRFPELLRLNNIQRNIRDILSQEPYSSQNLHTIYIGARTVLLDKSNPEKFYQCAYSLRDLISKIINRGEIIDDRNNSVFLQMEAFLNQIDELEAPSKSEFLGKWHDLYIYFNNISSRTFELMQEIFEQKFSILELVIWSLISPFYDVLTELESLMNIEDPTDENLERVRVIIGRQALFQYFFQHLTNPNWLPLLDRSGFYNVTNNKNEFRVEILYLEHIASERPIEVAAIIKRLSNIQHLGVLITFMRAILQLPIEEIRKLTQEIKIWMDSPISRNYALFEEVRNLITRLFAEGESEMGFELSDKLFDIEKYYLNEEQSEGA